MKNTHLRVRLRIDIKKMYNEGKETFYTKNSETQRLECMKMSSNDVKKYAKKIDPKKKFDFDKHPETEYTFYFEEEYKILKKD